jgi:hypothetical protein
LITRTLVAGGSGAVTILPDHIGFGASVNTHNRTTFTHKASRRDELDGHETGD